MSELGVISNGSPDARHRATDRRRVHCGLVNGRVRDIAVAVVRGVNSGDQPKHVPNVIERRHGHNLSARHRVRIQGTIDCGFRPEPFPLRVLVVAAVLFAAHDYRHVISPFRGE